MIEIGFGIALFAAIMTLLALMVQLARARLLPEGPVSINLGKDRVVHGRAGQSLLEILRDAGIALPSSCAGRGSCGLCRLTVLDGGGAVSPVEDSRLSRSDLAAGVRLACQIRVQHDIQAELPEDVIGAQRYTCTVVSTRGLAPFVKELTLAPPEGLSVDTRPGVFVQVTAPPHQLAFTTIDVAPEMRAKWDNVRLWSLESRCEVPTTRSYSVANTPQETGVLLLLVRLALPPPGPPNVPPGTVSSWLFSLNRGDSVAVSGPYGHFEPRASEREMIYIGGGVGMAPLRSHIFHLLKRQQSQRKISFWYGARSRAELFYEEQFEQLAREHGNFRWHVALSEPRPEDHWTGSTGFIHEVLYECYLRNHPAPEDCEYYLCGPPVMVRAVLNMLDGLGVDPDLIIYDDFGSGRPSAT